MLSNADEWPGFNCILVGEGTEGCNKFEAVIPIICLTNRGPIRFNVVGLAGQERYQFFNRGRKIQAHCAIILYDCIAPNGKQNIPTWDRMLFHNHGEIPSTTCCKYGIEIDTEEETVKTYDSFEQSCLWLAKTLLRDNNLKFLTNLGDPIRFNNKHP